MCFQDRTFCGHEHHDADCPRVLTDELKAKAEKWWGGPDYPVAYSPICSGGKKDGSQ